MVARCKTCELTWNISIKADLTKDYKCPHCRSKEKEMRELRKGVVTNVLLRNRKKFQAQR